MLQALMEMVHTLGTTGVGGTPKIPKLWQLGGRRL